MYFDLVSVTWEVTGGLYYNVPIFSSFNPTPVYERILKITFEFTDSRSGNLYILVPFARLSKGRSSHLICNPSTPKFPFAKNKGVFSGQRD